MRTDVPAAATVVVVRCTQYVSFTGARSSCTIVWPAPRVRAIALSKSLPTPKTHELARVVTSVADGAPAALLDLATAPIAPEPFVPVVSTFEKLTTVIDEATDCDRFADTVTFVSGAAANARQLSLVLSFALLPIVLAHEWPPPLMIWIVLF